MALGIGTYFITKTGNTVKRTRRAERKMEKLINERGIPFEFLDVVPMRMGFGTWLRKNSVLDFLNLTYGECGTLCDNLSGLRVPRI